MRAPMGARIFLLVSLIALPLAAQEPRPVTLISSFFDQPDGIALDFPWRYAPGDDPERALVQYDDSRWTTLAPDATPAGVGWFRRHLEVSPDVQNRPIALTFEAPGIGDVYLDGALVASVGRGTPSPLVPADRRETDVVTFRGTRHVIAVRYVYPPGAPRPNGTLGFRLTLARPTRGPGIQFRDPIIAIHGALVALPLFLALLHFALYAFDRRARENVFYAAEMLAFAVIVFHQYATNFLSGDAERAALDRYTIGGPILAIFFGMLTYYAVRMNRVPRSWRAVAAIGVVLLVLAYVTPLQGNIWVIYFGVILVEIVRVERSGRTVRRGGTVFFLVTFVVFSAAIVLQALINFGLLGAVAGVYEVYVFGILASAVGMSLYLAHNLGRSRVIELENERKTEELARARRLQLSMLPRELPRVEGLDVAVATETAAEVGGDYYDVRRDGDGALLLAFGDATGHGLASGIIVTAAKTLFMSIAGGASLDAHLAAFDRALREMRLPGFLRMCLALARVSPREAAVASAAMPPLLVRRSDSSVHELGRGGLPLGSRLPAKYEERRMQLQAGDTLLFASDGFAEQSRADGRQFGYDGVAGAFEAAGAEGDAQAVVTRLLAIAREFRGAQPQQDDITLLVVRVTASR